LEINFLYQKLCQGNVSAKVVQIVEVHKYSDFQNIVYIINSDYLYVFHTYQKSQQVYCNWPHISNFKFIIWVSFTYLDVTGDTEFCQYISTTFNANC
jgi:hypothetical protein